MNVQLPVQIDKPEFLAWVQGREERFELVEGRVVMMVGASRAHGEIVSNLVDLLREQLDRRQRSVIADFGLDAGPRTLRYPDVVVDQRAGSNAKDYTATAPVLIAEVLSPTTAEIDLGDKAAEYLRLPSLLAYLILSQDEYKAYVWIREAGAFAASPTFVAGLDETIRIAPLDLALPLAAVYEGIVLD
jgi:Uma2 family endonuclease